MNADEHQALDALAAKYGVSKHGLMVRLGVSFRNGQYYFDDQPYASYLAALRAADAAFTGDPRQGMARELPIQSFRSSPRKAVLWVFGLGLLFWPLAAVSVFLLFDHPGGESLWSYLAVAAVLLYPVSYFAGWGLSRHGIKDAGKSDRGDLWAGLPLINVALFLVAIIALPQQPPRSVPVAPASDALSALPRCDIAPASRWVLPTAITEAGTPHQPLGLDPSVGSCVGQVGIEPIVGTLGGRSERLHTALVFGADTPQACVARATPAAQRIVCAEDGVWVLGTDRADGRRDFILQQFGADGTLRQELVWQDAWRRGGEVRNIVGYGRAGEQVSLEVEITNAGVTRCVTFTLSLAESIAARRYARSEDSQIERRVVQALPGCGGLAPGG